MSIPYVVRKKADLSSGERKELWYGVPSKMQRRGGVKNKELAVRMAKTTGFHRGQIEGILSELVESIQDLLSSGHSVTIEYKILANLPQLSLDRRIMIRDRSQFLPGNARRVKVFLFDPIFS